MKSKQKPQDRACADCGKPAVKRDPHATNLYFCEDCYAAENPTN